jgi:hypothetical protein
VHSISGGAGALEVPIEATARKEPSAHAMRLARVPASQAFQGSQIRSAKPPVYLGTCRLAEEPTDDLPVIV